MTNKILISDNASTTLAAGIAANSPSMQVVSGAGALFPVLGANQAFVCTLIKSGAPTIREVVLVQGHASGSDNFTSLVRNFSGTGALAWTAGDIVELRPTAETFANFTQLVDLQQQLTNYAIDTGSATNYQAYLNPLPNASIIGMPIRWRAAHSNTGPSNFSDGITSAELVMPEGNPLVPGDIVTGGLYISVWDGTRFQLISHHHYAFSQIGGQVFPSQVPSGAIIQWESLLAIAFSQLTGQLQNGQIATSIALPGSPTTTTQGVGDSATRIATTAFVNPASLLGTNGFFKRADGHIIQAGQCNPNGGLITVTLPQAFPNAFQAVVGNSTGRPTQCNCVIASNSQFTISNTGGQSYWMAMGY